MLDDHPLILDAVERDFRVPDTAATGACGLSVESVFRCLLLKQILKVSYEKLSFHLADVADVSHVCSTPGGSISQSFWPSIYYSSHQPGDTRTGESVVARKTTIINSTKLIIIQNQQIQPDSHIAIIRFTGFTYLQSNAQPNIIDQFTGYDDSC